MTPAQDPKQPLAQRGEMVEMVRDFNENHTRVLDFLRELSEGASK